MQVLPPETDIRSLCLQNTTRVNEFVSMTLALVDIDNTIHADTRGSGSSCSEEDDAEDTDS